ncbi:MAG: hypothetical protein ACRDI0_08630 [Actinomycetota bacterium]
MERVSRVLGTLQSMVFLTALVSLVILLAGVLVEPAPNVRPLTPGTVAPGVELPPPLQVPAQQGSTPPGTSSLPSGGSFVPAVAIASRASGDTPSSLRSGAPDGADDRDSQGSKSGGGGGDQGGGKGGGGGDGGKGGDDEGKGHGKGGGGDHGKGKGGGGDHGKGHGKAGKAKGHPAARG